MKRLWWLPNVAALVLVIIFYHQWQHWLAYATGSYNTPGVAHNYNAFSGALSDLGEYSIAAGFFSHTAMLWKAHTCHLHWWCWRAPKYQLGDTPHMLCHVHHPDEQQTAKEALADYVADKETVNA